MLFFLPRPSLSTVSSVHTTRRSREEDASVVAPERGRVDSPRRRSTPTSRSPCAAAASSPSADGVDWIVIVRDPCASGRVIRVDGMPGWELIAKHQGPCKPHPNCLRTPRATLPTGLAGKASPVAAAVEAATGLRPHFLPRPSARGTPRKKIGRWRKERYKYRASAPPVFL